MRSRTTGASGDAERPPRGSARRRGSVEGGIVAFAITATVLAVLMVGAGSPPGGTGPATALSATGTSAELGSLDTAGLPAGPVDEAPPAPPVPDDLAALPPVPPLPPQQTSPDVRTSPDLPTSRTAAAPEPVPPAEPQIADVVPGTLSDLPNGVFGTPVVVTGSNLRVVERWATGVARARVVEARNDRVVLTLGLGTATGPLTWETAGSRGRTAFRLQDRVPRAVDARRVVWGPDCRFPQNTGMLWVGGTDSPAASASARSRPIRVRPVDGRGLLLMAGPQREPAVAVEQRGWLVRVPVSRETVDIKQFTAVRGLGVARCPEADGVGNLGFVRGVRTPRDVVGVEVDNESSDVGFQPAPFVLMPGGDLAVLRPPAATTGVAPAGIPSSGQVRLRMRDGQVRTARWTDPPGVGSGS